MRAIYRKGQLIAGRMYHTPNAPKHPAPVLPFRLTCKCGRERTVEIAADKARGATFRCQECGERVSLT